MDIWRIRAPFGQHLYQIGAENGLANTKDVSFTQYN